MVNDMDIIYKENEEYKNPKKLPITDDYDDSKSWEIRHLLEKHAVIAGMGEIVTSSADKRIIGTTALDTCYGIVFYDRYNKFGMVGHGTSSMKIRVLISMIEMLGDKQRIIEYAIVPGYRNVERGDYSGYEEILNYLYEHCPSNIKLIPFQGDLGVKVCPKVLAYEFAFDVNTSQTVSYYLFYNGQSDRYDKYLK